MNRGRHIPSQATFVLMANCAADAPVSSVPQAPARFEFLLRLLRPGQDPLARLAAVDLLDAARLGDDQFRRLLDSLGTSAPLSLETLLPCFRRSVSAITAPVLLDFLEQSLSRDWQPQEKTLQGLVNILPDVAHRR
ncbi:MAG: hypothetical protein DME19_10475 [Verrucomicrobia bacterium]|nr:MAG: hypothetical protein DME19_10475 [Verrucomicrobiota bacterium]